MTGSQALVLCREEGATCALAHPQGLVQVKRTMDKTRAAITHAHEDYLKAIYHLEQERGRATTTAVAEAMGVSAASATNMLKRLAELHLVEYTPYQGVRLTEAGRMVALEVIRHHRLLELFLSRALGMPWDKVHDEAERLEHVISEDLEEALAKALGDPVVDPHGDPIPTREGTVAERQGFPLEEAPLDAPLSVVRVRCQEPEILRYLGTLGIYPGTRLHIRERAPFHGPLLIQVGEEQHALARDIARCIYVEQVTGNE